MKTTRSAGLGPLIFATALALSCVTSAKVGGERQNPDPIKVNMAGLEHAKMLINGGLAVMDGKGDWAQHQPSAEEENEFIRAHGFDEYAKWHLGIDEGHTENSKARYKFPYGDFKNVRRSALLAVKGRASQYQHYEVEKAAIELIQVLEKKGR